MTKETTVLLFSKIPGLTPCKTRLAASTGLNEIFVSNLAVAFLADALELVSNHNSAVLFATQPEITAKDLTRLINQIVKFDLALDRFHFFPQSGSSFGQRLQNATDYTFSQNNSGIVILGSDAPLLSPRTLEQACQLVAAGKFCLGPTPDGGIYLIGLPQVALARKFSIADVFEDKSETELASLAKKMSSQDIQLEILEFLFDVDIESDLVTLNSMLSALESAQKANKVGRFWRPLHTADFLESHPIQAFKTGADNRKNEIKLS